MLDDPERLRRRAAALRAVADRLDGLAVHHLVRLADASTWVGPTGEHCLDELSSWSRRLSRDAGDLRAAARGLDHRAAVMTSPAAPR